MRMTNPKAKLGFMSIKGKLLFALLIVMLPFILLMIYSNIFVLGVTRNQVAQSSRNLINLYMEQVDRNLLDINKYLLNLAAQDQNMLYLERSKETDPDSYNLSKIRLFNKLTNYNIENFSIDYFFVYSVKNLDLMFAPGNFLNTDYADRQKMQEIFTSYILNQTTNGGYQFTNWRVIYLGNRPYLFQIIYTDGIYLGAMIDVKKLEAPLHTLDFGISGHALFLTEHKEPIGDSGLITFAKQNHMNFNYKNDSYILTGDNDRYLLLGNHSTQSNFSLIVMLLDNEVLKKSPFVQRVAVLTIGGTLFIIFFSLIFIQRTILHPISTIMGGMRRLRDGNLDTRIAPYTTAREFALMHESFNSMASQLQELKIDIYEERLKHQAVLLKQLQQQINPHFFLNALNVIYYLAQVKNYALIQEMSISLIQYFRFMFQLKSDFVSLQDEVKHTHNYLRIQELRFPDYLTYTLSIPDALMNCLVAPLIIQTFVENAIKYAQSMDKALHIKITVTLEEQSSDEPMIRILIKDSGTGFSDDILELLQHNQDLSHEEGGHIGIWNMKRRLDLLYQGRAWLAFSNALEPDEGAMVDIRFPFVKEQ